MSAYTPSHTIDPGDSAARERTSPPAWRWAFTVLATVMSTYALDAVATATGVLLAASHVLRSLDHGLLLALLATSYVLWGVGLRANLRANWSLLEATDTSSNVLSKAAYDLARLRHMSRRVRRAAAASGYVLTELVKEVAYYAGAFGAVLLTDSVASSDALIFLAGANLGAALYEYGLAGVTRAFLRRRARREAGATYASFDDDWVPKEYLADYYRVVEPDERETIAFFVDAMRRVEPGEPMLFFGVGPTLHHVFLAAGTVSEIHLADYLPANLREIERWLERDADAHDWRPFVRYTLECEGLLSPTEEEITQREEVTRAKITRLLPVDARREHPLGDGGAARYQTVLSAYCADSATDDRATWEAFMVRIAGLVRPEGMLITAALRRCRSYVVGGKAFPSANVDERDLEAALQPGFAREHRRIEVRELEAHDAQGYSSIILARAQKNPSWGPLATARRPGADAVQVVAAADPAPSAATSRRKCSPRSSKERY